VGHQGTSHLEEAILEKEATIRAIATRCNELEDKAEGYSLDLL